MSSRVPRVRCLKQIAEPHCQQCGRIVGKECGHWEGYTSCCNELVVGGADAMHPCQTPDCYHDMPDDWDGRIA